LELKTWPSDRSVQGLNDASGAPLYYTEDALSERIIHAAVGKVAEIVKSIWECKTRGLVGSDVIGRCLSSFHRTASRRDLRQAATGVRKCCPGRNRAS